MQPNILEIFRRSQSNQLTEEDIDWLKGESIHSPYFSMAYMLLAKQGLESPNGELKKAATYALDRAQLKKYLETKLAEIELKEEAPVVPKAEETKTETPEVSKPKAEEPKVVEPKVEAPKKETPKVEPPKVETPAEEPAAEPIKLEPIAINFYLDTRVSMRAEKYVRLDKRIVLEMQEFKSKLEAPAEIKSQPEKIETKAPAKKPATKKPAAKKPVAKKPTTKKPAEKKPATKKPAAKKPAAKKPATKKTAPKKETGLEFLDEKDAKKKSSKTKTADEKFGIQSDYQIGAYSDLLFVTEDDLKKQKKKSEEKKGTAKISKTSKKKKKETFQSEIILETDDRIVEISVTPDQLKKYFKDGLKKQSKKKPTKTEEKKIDDIIDKFIEEEPTLTDPKVFQLSGDHHGKESNKEDKELISETLAKIHAKQGNIKKATEMYEKLKLIFPEKSTYFADQIKKLIK